MKSLVFIILIFFASASCASQKPKHLIYGKWKSTASPPVVFTFGDNDSMEAEIFNENGEARAWNYHYTAMDEKTVRIFYENQGDAKVSVYVKIEGDNKLTLACVSRESSGGKLMIDPPELCVHREFIRIKE